MSSEWWAALAIGAAIVVGCGSSNAGAPAPSAPAGGAVITANASAFDRDRVDVPAGRPFALLFQNREGAPHNVTILPPGGSEPLFTGEVFSGPASRTYQIPALPAGTYSFRCDVHPQMTGTVVAS